MKRRDGVGRDRVRPSSEPLGLPEARREVPAALRGELLATLNALQADMRTLRKNARCPDDVAR